MVRSVRDPVTVSKCASCGGPMSAVDASQSATHRWCKSVANGRVRSLNETTFRELPSVNYIIINDKSLVDAVCESSSQDEE